MRFEYDVNDRLKIYSEYYSNWFSETKEYLTSVSVIDTLTSPNDTIIIDVNTLDVPHYKFKATVSNAKIGALWALNTRSRIDAGAAYTVLDHEMEIIEGTRKSYTINYPALLPYIIYKYDIHTKFTGEIAYMGSYTVNEDENNYYLTRTNNPQPYWDKELIKLGFEYRFSPNASLYISAGQLMNTNVFGGGNARFNLVF